MHSAILGLKMEQEQVCEQLLYDEYYRYITVECCAHVLESLRTLGRTTPRTRLVEN